MTIIGIDPGYAITGWAVLKSGEPAPLLIACGALQVKEKKFYGRMMETASSLEKIIKKYKPEEAGMEKIFFNKNIKTAMDVAQVRGAMALLLLRHGVGVFDYTPLQVKQAVAGYGQAGKEQVQKMVCLLLNIKSVPGPDDVADAIAAGICHINSCRWKNITEVKTLS